MKDFHYATGMDLSGGRRYPDRWHLASGSLTESLAMVGNVMGGGGEGTKRARLS